MGNQQTTSEECEWCEKEYPSYELKKINIFWGFCYQTICKACEEKYPVDAKVQGWAS